MQHVMLQAMLPSLRLVAAASRITVQQCRYAHSAVRSSAPRETLHSSVISPSEPTSTSDDGLRILRTRKNANPPLPIPPIMDPVYLGARDKHKHTKQDQDQSHLTPFQQELSINPHALALATPVRMCAVSRARLPSHFLLSFGLFARANDFDGGSGKPFYKLVTSQTFRPRGMIGQASYVQATYSAVKSLGGQKGTTPRYVKLANQRAREVYARLTKRAGAGSVDPATEWEWDPNMAEVVREAKVKDIVRALGDIFNMGLLKPVDEVEQGDMAAIVRFRSSDDALLAEFGHAARYDLFTWSDETALRQSLGELRIHHGAMAIVKDRRSIYALIALEKLRIYVGG